jgi:hypothetical protein
MIYIDARCNLATFVSHVHNLLNLFIFEAIISVAIYIHWLCKQKHTYIYIQFQEVIPEIITSETRYINVDTILDSYRAMGRGKRVSAQMQPPRSPDLNPFHFHVWGYMKDLVYEGKTG